MFTKGTFSVLWSIHTPLHLCRGELQCSKCRLYHCIISMFNWHVNVQHIGLKVPLFGRGGIFKDLKPIGNDSKKSMITVRYSTSQFSLPCPSSNSLQGLSNLCWAVVEMIASSKHRCLAVNYEWIFRSKPYDEAWAFHGIKYLSNYQVLSHSLIQFWNFISLMETYREVIRPCNNNNVFLVTALNFFLLIFKCIYNGIYLISLFTLFHQDDQKCLDIICKYIQFHNISLWWKK